MDRCHRIGQTRPVLVMRLKGAFLDLGGGGASTSANSSLSATELLELLKTNGTGNDAPQSDKVSDADLARLLNRSHLAQRKPAPYGDSGVGYEVRHCLLCSHVNISMPESKHCKSGLAGRKI